MIIILLLIIQNSDELDAAKAYLHGKELYSRGKHAEAIGEFRKALELDSTLTEVYQELGWVLLDYGKVDSAESIYKQIIKRYPENAYFHCVYGWILLNKDDYAESMKEINAAISLDAQFSDYYYTRAYLYYYWKNDLDNAEKDLQKALDLNNNNFAVIKLLGNIFHDQGEYENEKELYRNSLKYESSSWVDLNNRGEIAVRIMDWQEALKTFDELYKLNPDYEGIACRLADCNAMTGNNDRALSLYNDYISKNPQDSYAYKALGILCHDLKLNGEAKKILIKANKVFPDSIAFEILLGYIYVDQNPDSALIWINMSKSKKINDQSLYNYLGLVYMQTDSLPVAIKCWKKFLQTDSTNARCWANLGNSHLRMKDYESACICFEKSLKYDSLIATTYIGLGRINEKKQKYNNAIDLFKKALSIDSLNTYALSDLGRACLMAGDTNFALDCFRKAIIIDPTLWENYEYLISFDWQNTAMAELKKLLLSTSNNSRLYQPYYLLAELFFSESKDDSALIFANRALAIAPDRPDLYILAGHLHQNLKNRSKAFQCFLDAYECKSSDSLTHAFICQSLFDLGEYAEAKERVLELLENHPHLAYPHYTIGLIYIRENKNQEAIQELNKYLDLKPDAKDKKFVEEMITDLKKYIKN